MVKLKSLLKDTLIRALDKGHHGIAMDAIDEMIKTRITECTLAERSNLDARTQEKVTAQLYAAWEKADEENR